MTTSIVIAAHNEGRVIGRGLGAILDQARPGEFQIVVVANGCVDDTVDAARRRPSVHVIELAAAGKSAALNAGDVVATGYPRVYLDADVTMATADIRALVTALDEPGVFATTARRELDTAGAPLLVRAYSAINRRLPVYRDALFGRGVVAMSRAGRSRFTGFPGQIADDLFLDSLFQQGEKREVSSVVSTVAVPRRTRDLVRRLARVRAGNRALRTVAPRARAAANTSWWRDVVLPRPWLLPAAVCYVGVIIAAELLARKGVDWAQDESTRADATR